MSKVATSKRAKVTKSATKGRSAATGKGSSILKAVHESAQDLHSIGVIDKTTMREFDVLCLPKVPQYTPKQIKSIRTRCRTSQTVFAKYLNVTPSSLQKWEIGTKKPSGVALKLLNLVDKKGLDVLI